MKHLIIVPIGDAHLFKGLKEVSRDCSLVAFVGESIPERSRHGFASEELFLEAVARGDADRYSFNTVEEAAAFARKKLEMLNRIGRAIEDRTNERLSRKKEPFPSVKQIPKQKKVTA
jgi:hypothetical protein